MKIKVLDHGYVELVESWGSDERIVEAARMSTQKGFLGWGSKHSPDCFSRGPAGPNDPCRECGQVVSDGDERLLRYLWDHKHATPFEMAGMTIEVQAPIFVFREWHRHRTQSYNEMSARYAPLPDMNYVPTVERLMMGGGHLTKQAAAAAGSNPLTEEQAQRFRDTLKYLYKEDEETYQSALRAGIPKELARLVLPVGRYSRMRASANLRNWLAFLTLRQAPDAQWEIRQFANVVGVLIEQAFPRTWELFARKVA